MASMPSGVVTVGVSRWATIVAACSAGCSLSTRIGASIPASRRATPSAVRATQSPAQPAAIAARGDGDGAVAVAVGLDDGPHRRRRDGRPEHADVVGEGVEVDLGPRPAAGRRRQTHPSDSSTVGRVVEEVAGDESRSAAPSRAASAWIHGAGGRRVEGGHAGGQQGAEDAGQDVAGAGRRQPGVAGRHDADLAAGLGDDRRRTLEHTTAPVSAASRRAAAKRSAPGRRPASRPNSPSCGVRTVGIVAPAQQRCRAVGVPGHGEQAVAVDHGRDLGAGDGGPDRRDGELLAAEPGTDDEAG